MMNYLFPLWQNTSIWLLSFSLISILFFYFALRVKFSVAASLKRYGVFIYAWVFYSIAALSFVLLNATDSLLRLQNDIYAQLWFFIPYVLLVSLVGAFCGYLLFMAASKVAAPYTLLLLNISLMLIVPALVYTLAVQPVNASFAMLQQLPVVPKTPIEINELKLLEEEGGVNENLITAIPSDLVDSMLIVHQDHKLHFYNNQNGFHFAVKSGLVPVQNLYVLSPQEHFSYLAVLCLSPRLQNRTELIVVDTLGNCVFKKLYDRYYNLLEYQVNNQAIQLRTREVNDSISTGIFYRLP